VFGRKKPSRSHRQRLVDELTESYGHLKLAAGQVAGGAAEKVTPTYDRARDAAVRSFVQTLSPLYEQIKDGAAIARREQHPPKRKWPILVGLLAAGAAVGAAGAMIARRRRAAAQWDDYEPLPSVDDLSYGADTATAGGASKKVTAGAASVAESLSAGAGKIAESLSEKSGRSSGTSSGSSAASGSGSSGSGSAASGSSASGSSGSSDKSGKAKGTFAPFAEEGESANSKNARP
jgi:hypothetical protein